MLKEIKLEKDNNFITKYGTTLDEVKPHVLYLRTKAKIIPTEKKKTYEADIDDVKNLFSKYVSETILKSVDFESDYLFSVDISSKNVSYNKSSFLRYDIYLKPTNRKTLIANTNLFTKYSLRFDKKLMKLLAKYNIECK